MRASVFACVIGMTCATHTFAQAPLRNAEFDVPVAALQPVAQRPAPPAQMVLGGLLGGAVGFFGGGFAGALLYDDPDRELSALHGFAMGAVIGETVTLPFGVHVANRLRGNYGISLLAASALTGIGIAFAASGEDHLEYLIPVPALQLVTSILIERATTN